ncbi:hypothetical protein CL621_04295 [archaeon]|nr:hypothetical protein [archaeon]
MNPLSFYSKKEIQKAIAKIAKDREIVVKYGDKGFGKRPDIVQFDGDILELAKQGVTSFHISEEHWSDPLKLQPGMMKKQLDELRTGWDFLIDIDAEALEYSKVAANLIVEALKFHDIKDISVKYSGNRGFHIGIPFEAFPDKVNNQDTKMLFPEGTRVIALYLKQLIEEQLKSILKNETPFSLVDVDTVLISNRHTFRAPYSLHEKTGLASIPIKPDQILSFKKEQAEPEKVKFDIKFLENVNKNEASQLIIQAFDWHSKNIIKVVEIKPNREYDIPKIAVKEDFFPPCIKFILDGLKDDGRKRSLFILINFLSSLGWKSEDMQNLLLEWDKKNHSPLKDGYVKSQLMWYKKRKKAILPPNCSNEAYYKSINICKPDNLCKMIKNPVNYSVRKTRFKKRKKKS